MYQPVLHIEMFQVWAARREGVPNKVARGQEETGKCYSNDYVFVLMQVYNTVSSTCNRATYRPNRSSTSIVLTRLITLKLINQVWFQRF